MLRKIIEGLDSVDLNSLLKVNIAIASINILSYVSRVALASFIPTLKGADITLLKIANLTFSIIILSTAVLALFVKKWKIPIIVSHAIILTINGIYALSWATSILINGIPQGRFSWGLGMLTFLCVYKDRCSPR